MKVVPGLRGKCDKLRQFVTNHAHGVHGGRSVKVLIQIRRLRRRGDEIVLRGPDVPVVGGVDVVVMNVLLTGDGSQVSAMS